jgi:periplasmic divalent cation tolerance protein
MFPMYSMYRWKGKVVQEGETALLVKSKTSKWNRLKKEVTAIHSYDCPCIEKINVSWNKPYADWVAKEVK